MAQPPSRWQRPSGFRCSTGVVSRVDDSGQYVRDPTLGSMDQSRGARGDITRAGTNGAGGGRILSSALVRRHNEGW
eukprot:1191608-Prorocentrum_minimum.AAC.6